jgi:hypothetical protein
LRLSDEAELTRALNLPTMQVAAHLIKWLLIIDDARRPGAIRCFPPIGMPVTCWRG